MKELYSWTNRAGKVLRLTKEQGNNFELYKIYELRSNDSWKEIEVIKTEKKTRNFCALLEMLLLHAPK